jgi:hypothetical protein
MLRLVFAFEQRFTYADSNREIRILLVDRSVHDPGDDAVTRLLFGADDGHGLYAAFDPVQACTQAEQKRRDQQPSPHTTTQYNRQKEAPVFTGAAGLTADCVVWQRD